MTVGMERGRDTAQPLLWIEHVHEHAFGEAGKARVWTLAGRGVKELTAQLLLCSEGRAERVTEVRCAWDEASPPLDAQLVFWDQGGKFLALKGKRLPSLSLDFRSGPPDKKSEKHTGKLAPEPVGGDVLPVLRRRGIVNLGAGRLVCAALAHHAVPPAQSRWE